MEDSIYSKIVVFKQEHLNEAVHDHFKLNNLHDAIIKQVVEVSKIGRAHV